MLMVRWHCCTVWLFCTFLTCMSWTSCLQDKKRRQYLITALPDTKVDLKGKHSRAVKLFCSSSGGTAVQNTCHVTGTSSWLACSACGLSYHSVL
jgi:hypothetical protein